MGISMMYYPTVCLPHYTEDFARNRGIGKSGARSPLAEVVAEYPSEPPRGKARAWLAGCQGFHFSH